MPVSLSQNAGGTPWVQPQSGLPTQFFLRFIDELARAIPLPVTTDAFSVGPAPTAAAVAGDVLAAQVAQLRAEVAALQGAFVQMQQDLAKAGVLRLRE